MYRLAKTTCLVCMLLMLIPMNASAGIKGKKASRFDWTPVINAIIEVESEGNAKAVDKSGKSCGCMNGGINFTKRGTQKYYRKVMSKMK